VPTASRDPPAPPKTLNGALGRAFEAGAMCNHWPYCSSIPAESGLYLIHHSRMRSYGPCRRCGCAHNTKKKGVGNLGTVGRSRRGAPHAGRGPPKTSPTSRRKEKALLLDPTVVSRGHSLGGYIGRHYSLDRRCRGYLADSVRKPVFIARGPRRWPVCPGHVRQSFGGQRVKRFAA